MKAGVDYIGVAVGLFIISDKGEVFLTKRSQNTTNERGTWEIPGGKVNFGETLQEAAKREAREEYGIDIKLIEQFPAQNHLIPEEKQHWVPTSFLANIIGNKKPKIMEPDKCDAIGWFSINKLPKPLSIITKIDINQYLKRIKDRKLCNC
jgi:mutator protein MutT